MIEVELIHGGEDIGTFHPLLVVDDDGHTHVGKEVAKAQVTAKLVGEQKGDKVKVFKYRPKTGLREAPGPPPDVHAGRDQRHHAAEVARAPRTSKKDEAGDDGRRGEGRRGRAEAKPAEARKRPSERPRGRADSRIAHLLPWFDHGTQEGRRLDAQRP